LKMTSLSFAYQVTVLIPYSHRTSASLGPWRVI
jgi:hypothetical protein